MDNDNIYGVDFKKLTVLLLPTFLRQPVMRTFLKVFSTPLQWLKTMFDAGRATDLFREGIDSTVPRLEYLLNSRFYPDGLTTAYSYRIVIGKTIRISALNIYLGGIMQPEDEGLPCVIWKTGEAATPSFPQQFIYTNNEAGEICPDFVVKVPVSIQFDERQMRSLVQAYALPGKEFTVIGY
ncbi:MAG: hypothetical protein LBG92_03060 [Prevotellaceae bacterium]|jgi:hypothetical protein|nr:hypothetical protein [Prevotellaceae bacterium]